MTYFQTQCGDSLV